MYSDLKWFYIIVAILVIDRAKISECTYDLFIFTRHSVDRRDRRWRRDGILTSRMTQQNKTMNFLIHDANGEYAECAPIISMPRIDDNVSISL